MFPFAGNSSMDHSRAEQMNCVELRQKFHERQLPSMTFIPRSLFAGRVIEISDRSGVMESLLNLPSCFSPATNVIFNPRSANTGGLKVMIGDVLEFSLDHCNKSEPVALNATLQTAKRRSNAEFEELFDRIYGTVEDSKNYQSEDGDSDTEVVSTTTQFLLDVVTCDAIWVLIGNFVTRQHVSKIVSVILRVEELLKCSPKRILTAISETSMFTENTGALHVYIMEETTSCSRPVSKLSNIRKLMLLMFKHVPEKGDTFRELIDTLELDHKNGIDMELLKYKKYGINGSNKQKWHDLPLVPTMEEMTKGDFEICANLKPVREKGSYGTSEVYLETYFRLLRADCFGNLCTYLKEFIKGDLDPRNMSVYHSVKLVGISANSGRVAYRLQFIPVIPVRDWTISSNLIYGNLLCISPSGTFKSPIWASVANRDIKLLKKNCSIDVDLCENNMSISAIIVLMSQTNKGMVMVESPTYYNAYKPVLQALKTRDPDNLPFEEELVHGQESEERPKYISNIKKQLKLTTKAFVDRISQKWPPTLDKSQQHSMERTFRKRISCIQGPPGTGKTFIGIKLVRTILEIEERPETPILILTYKNHALDEFLKELISDFEVVRIGGRSKDSEIQLRNLNELKKSLPEKPSLLRKIKRKCKEITLSRSKVINCIRNLDKSLVWSTQTFIENMTREQINNLLTGCDWKDCVKLTGMDRKHLERISICFSRFKGDIRVFFESNSERTAFDFALQKWMPSQRETKYGEYKKYSRTISKVLDEMSRKYANKDESSFDDEYFDDLQIERMVATNSDELDSFVFIDIRSSSMKFTNHLSFLSSVDGYVEKLASSSVASSSDLWSLSTSDRIKLIQKVQLRQVSGPAQRLEESLCEYEQLCKEKKDLNDQHKLDVLKSMNIIGMTITGASINAELLAALKPAIVIIEEAAEVLEAQILATLGDWVEHLIMIGDHKQLRPSVNYHELTTKFHMDISMMERLINNGIRIGSLAVQNRMRPEFAKLLLDIYPKLSSSERVKTNPAPKCVEKSMFFWNHNDNENVDRRSYANMQEAKSAIKLALFFVHQGYDPQRITILCAYQGQVALIREEIRAGIENFDTLTRNSFVKVYTIDMYQGDENDIVIVSLVRSNNDRNIGFLNTLNRRCVAQSRARCGMYFIGNSNTLSSNANWGSLILKMKQQLCYGDEITLQCSRHQSSKLKVRTGSGNKSLQTILH